MDRTHPTRRSARAQRDDQLRVEIQRVYDEHQQVYGELIENRFEGEDYKLMVVANKFQTGFDQPLLAGMFLDKPVVDRQAVQTISRLNRSHAGKKDVVVVDFTNNARTRVRLGVSPAPTAPTRITCATLRRVSRAR